MSEIQNNANQFKPPKKIGIFFFFLSVKFNYFFYSWGRKCQFLTYIYMYIYKKFEKRGKKSDSENSFTCRQKKICNTIFFFSEMAVQKIWPCTNIPLHSFIHSAKQILCLIPLQTLSNSVLCGILLEKLT